MNTHSALRLEVHRRRLISHNPQASMIRFWYLFILLCHSNKIPAVDSNATADEKLKSEDVWEFTHGKIIFSAVIIRHGDRYPFGNFSASSYEILRHDDRNLFEDPPTSPKTIQEFTSGENGPLTKKGKKKSYQLGRWLREHYSHLINDRPYDSSVLNMLSSHTDRTIMTGQLVLAGLYPPVYGNEVWNKDINWQPIPVYSLPENERLIDGHEYCPRFNVEMEHVKNSPEFLKFYELHKEMFDYMKENFLTSLPFEGLDPKIESLLIACAVYDLLENGKDIGLVPPEWTKKIDNESLRIKIRGMEYKFRSFNHEMKRLKGGPLLGHIIDELKKKRDNIESKKLFQFYSGHDLNIITILNMLGVWNEDHIPGPCSTIHFELRKLEEHYIVTVGLKDPVAPFEILKLPKAPELCTLDDFIEVTKDLIPEDWDTECQTFVPDYNTIV